MACMKERSVVLCIIAHTSWENLGVKRDRLQNTINRQNLSLRDRWVDAVFLDAAKAFI